MLDNRLQTIARQLAKMTPQQRQQFAAIHKDDPIMLGMAKFVNDQQQALSLALQGAQAGSELAKPPVVDQAIAQMVPPAAGLGALPAPNMEQMPDGGVAGYAEGGGVKKVSYASTEAEKDRALIFRAEMRKAMERYSTATTPEDKERAQRDIDALTREMKSIGLNPHDFARRPGEVTGDGGELAAFKPPAQATPAAAGYVPPAPKTGIAAAVPQGVAPVNMPAGLAAALTAKPAAPIPQPNPEPWQVQNSAETPQQASERITNTIPKQGSTSPIGRNQKTVLGGQPPMGPYPRPLVAGTTVAAGLPALGNMPESVESETRGTNKTPELPPAQIIEAAQKAAPEMKGKGMSGEDWLQLGLNLMANKSPYFLTALGESGIATLRAKEGRAKLESEAEYRTSLGRQAESVADYNDYLRGPTAALASVDRQMKEWAAANEMNYIGRPELFKQAYDQQRRRALRETYRAMGIPVPGGYVPTAADAALVNKYLTR